MTRDARQKQSHSQYHILPTGAIIHRSELLGQPQPKATNQPTNAEGNVVDCSMNSFLKVNCRYCGMSFLGDPDDMFRYQVFWRKPFEKLQPS